MVTTTPIDEAAATAALARCASQTLGIDAGQGRSVSRDPGAACAIGARLGPLPPFGSFPRGWGGARGERATSLFRSCGPENPLTTTTP